ncbi:MAG: hypothetical protein LUQ69_10315 [Methanoregulaceae archaeon]|nr:hypothetical protein [Methanoregulaceae archaeon]
MNHSTSDAPSKGKRKTCAAIEWEELTLEATVMWCVDKLRTLEKLPKDSEYDRATIRTIRHSLEDGLKRLKDMEKKR